MDPERGRGEDASLERAEDIFFLVGADSGSELVYTVRGSGFLHHMVSNLVGTFILVGRGTLQVEDITRILDARNRRRREPPRRRADCIS